MKKKRSKGYIIALTMLGILLLAGIFLLIAGLQMGPDPLTMPWSVAV